MPTLRMGESDTTLINHPVMREFVSKPPISRSIHRRVRDRKSSLGESSWAVCGFRTEFCEKRQFFGSSFLCKLWVFEEHSPFCDIKPHMHILRVYGHWRWRQSPRQVSTSHRSETRTQSWFWRLQGHDLNSQRSINSSISRFSSSQMRPTRVSLLRVFFFFPSFFSFKNTSVALLKLWEVEDFANLGTPVPKESYHHLRLSPMTPNELWTSGCPDDGATRAQAPGYQRSSCRSVRTGRGGDRCSQWRS